MTKEILVLNGSSYGDSVDGLGRLSARTSYFIEKPNDFSLVLFTGGEDVDPSFYGDTSPNKLCWSNPKRDIQEQFVFHQALKNGIPMAGICRGLQFLNVMDGGRLMHHIENHGGCTHLVQTNKGEYFLANSLHHQMVVPREDALVTAWVKDKRSTVYYGTNDKYEEYEGEEIEAAIFPAIKAFGVQYHPEMMHQNSDGFMYFYDMVRRAISLDWSDFVDFYTTENKHDKPAKESKSLTGFTG